RTGQIHSGEQGSHAAQGISTISGTLRPIVTSLPTPQPLLRSPPWELQPEPVSSICVEPDFQLPGHRLVAGLRLRRRGDPSLAASAPVETHRPSGFVVG